jgi:hypothetical protein
MAYGQVNADVIGTSVTGSNLGAGNASIMKNRILNGGMVIDQRNAGASVTPVDSTFPIDRFGYYASQASKFTVGQNLNAVNPPVGFSNYLGFQTLSVVSIGAADYFMTAQNIEGFNSADLGFGTANAKTVTLSFQVYSSLTGTFGGVLKNNAATRSYPFTYSIPVANTWTTISITIAGDTSGTWVGATNGIGIRVQFGLGVGSTYSGTAGSWASANYISATGATSVVGTSGATFYITGVQLEVGSSATGFEYRQYGQELALCQRYFAKTFDIATAPASNTGQQGALLTVCGSGTGVSVGYIATWFYPVSMRASATITTYNPSLAGQSGWYTSGGVNIAAATGNQGNSGAIVYNNATATSGTNGAIHLTASAEL